MNATSACSSAPSARPRASIIAAFILAGTALAGDWLLQQLGITLPAFRIAGGLLLFAVASEMVFGVRIERQSKQAEEALEDHHDLLEAEAVGEGASALKTLKATLGAARRMMSSLLESSARAPALEPGDLVRPLHVGARHRRQIRPQDGLGQVHGLVVLPHEAGPLPAGTMVDVIVLR